MKDRAGLERMTREQDRRISDVVLREQSRLRRFIRGRVPDPHDADILQDVFSAFVEANRLLMPIEHVTGWLFRVARNRIASGRTAVPGRGIAGAGVRERLRSRLRDRWSAQFDGERESRALTRDLRLRLRSIAGNEQ